MVNIHPAGNKGLVLEDLVAVQFHIGLDAFHHDFVQRIFHAGEGDLAVFAPGDQLADQGVVVGGHGVATVDMGIHPYTITAGGMEIGDLAGAGSETHWIFSVDAHLDGMALELHVGLLQLQAFVAGDTQLFLDDVDTGDHFCDRVFHLHAGVHLNEVETFIFVEELESAGTPVIDFLAGVDATLGHFVFQVLGNVRRWCFFHHFLVTTLQGAVPVAQMNGMAGAVG